jgi:type IV pilus assembly protein PilC
MGVAMSESGTTLMRLGTAVGWIVLVLVALIVLAVVVLAVLSRTGKREQVLAFLYRVFPPLASLSRKLSASRVSGVLSMMLSSGFPMEDALDMTSKVLSDKEAAEKVASIRTGLSEGKTFADSVADTGLFDELHNSMVRMGSATGHEDQVLSKLSELYEEQVEDGISQLISIIEPTLVALLAVVIGAVLLSVMLPMAGILTSL